MEIIALSGNQLGYGVDFVEHRIETPHHAGPRPMQTPGRDRLGPTEPQRLQQFLVIVEHGDPRHQSSVKSSGTSPNVLRITASSNSPTFGSPRRENATAPALALSQDIARARRIAPYSCGHSTARPGASPPSTGWNGNAT